MNRIAAKIGLLTIFLAPGLGCAGTRMPRLYNPGNASSQQYSATQLADPYPSPNAGPEIVGGRPRGYQTPRAEVKEAQRYSINQRQPRFIAPAPRPVYSVQPAR